MTSLITSFNNLFKAIDFLGPLAMRLYLAVIFWEAGLRKVGGFDGFVGYVESLGVPMPLLFAALAVAAEVVGAVALLLGFGVRYAALALLATMAVASLAHIDNGFLAIADGRDPEIATRLAYIAEIISKYGYADYLQEKGRIVILNNGVQFVLIYAAMLLTLVGTGGGKLVSVDYYLMKKNQ